MQVRLEKNERQTGASQGCCRSRPPVMPVEPYNSCAWRSRTRGRTRQSEMAQRHPGSWPHSVSP
jgi:hypothetical protein